MLKIKPVKKISFFIIISFLSIKSYAADTLYFSGNIYISKKIKYAYNLRFTIGGDNKITGYSLTDAKGTNETKNRITGVYDSIAKTIFFEEKAVLRSKIDLEKKDLCFVKAILKLTNNKYIETLSGRFTGTQIGLVTPCATGDIKLINTNRLKVIIKENNDLEFGKLKTKEENKIITIIDESAKYLSFTGKKVKLIVWDNSKVDGDKVSILLNGKYILENYTLTNELKIIEETLSDNKIDTITIIALNEGLLPPNTATIKIESLSESYSLEIQARANEKRTIYLTKKDNQHLKL